MEQRARTTSVCYVTLSIIVTYFPKNRVFNYFVCIFNFFIIVSVPLPARKKARLKKNFLQPILKNCRLKI